jgi:hypothetical protein
MGDLKSLLRECSAIDGIFDGQPAYVITPNNLDVFLDWLEFNSRYEGTQDTYDFIQEVKDTNPDLLIVLYKSQLQLNVESLSHGVTPVFQDAADIPVGRGQPLLSSRFIRYDIVKSDTFLGMFDLPPKSADTGTSAIRSR